MLVACRLAGLSALETYYAGIGAGAQFGPSRWHIAIKAAERPFRGRRVGWTQPRAKKPPAGFPVARSREEKRGGRRTEAIIRNPPLGAFLRQGDHGSRPRRLCVP
jgi:hypothetical protein